MLQATAIELLCRCDDIADEGVELRVLKGLLTAVTSPTVHVHGQALLLAVRTCYNIFLLSRSEVNQTTAKASLTQMLNLVFQRMEAGSESVHPSPAAVSDQLGLPPADASSVTAFVNSFLHEVRISAFLSQPADSRNNVQRLPAALYQNLPQRIDGRNSDPRWTLLSLTSTTETGPWLGVMWLQSSMWTCPLFAAELEACMRRP